jgi:hypothetical protein
MTFQPLPEPPMDLDLFWRNRRASTTPLIELDTTVLDGASMAVLATANVRAMRSAINSPDACRQRVRYADAILHNRPSRAARQ